MKPALSPARRARTVTDLSEWDVDLDVDEPAGEEDRESVSESSSYGSGRQYSNPRCRSIKTDGSGRCRSPSHAIEDGLCHNHAMRRDPVTIDSSPRELIRWTTRTEIDNLPGPVQDALEAVAEPGG